MERQRPEPRARRGDGVIIWVTPTSAGAIETLREVERSLLLAGLGTPELARGLAAVARRWELDPDGLPARRPGMRGWLAHAHRRLVHRLVWWHHRDQLVRIGEFHGLVNHTFQYLARALAESERSRRAESAALADRIDALEARLLGDAGGAGADGDRRGNR